MRGSDQMGDHRQVAAPQRPARGEFGGTLQRQFDVVARTGEQCPAMIARERGWLGRTEIVGCHRPGEAHDSRMPPRRKLEGGEVAVTEPSRLRGGQRVEIDPIQQARPAVAAAHGDRQIDARIRRHTHYGRQALVVGRRKALPAPRCRGVDDDAVPERLEP
jgi:hypothetical protein